MPVKAWALVLSTLVHLALLLFVRTGVPVAARGEPRVQVELIRAEEELSEAGAAEGGMRKQEPAPPPAPVTSRTSGPATVSSGSPTPAAETLPAAGDTESLPAAATESAASPPGGGDAQSGSDAPPAPAAGPGEAAAAASLAKAHVYLPPVLLQDVAPVYPDIARFRGWEGRVVLELSITIEGRVGQVEVSESSGYEQLDRAAVEAALQWRYIPARRNGEAVEARLRRTVRFQLT